MQHRSGQGRHRGKAQKSRSWIVDGTVNEIVKARTNRDPDFRKALLRDYINAMVRYEASVEKVNSPSKSLMRMFGPGRNPHARSLFPIIAYIRRRE